MTEAPSRTGAQLVTSEGRWLNAGAINSPLVVFVHGFTSHGQYLTNLADYVGASGFSCAVFNYDSYQGIDRAASELVKRLQALEEQVRRHSFVLVGHSMGGIVATYFATIAEQMRDYLRGIILLGSPRTGFPRNDVLISRFVEWAERLTGLDPHARSVACRSLLQLTCVDGEHLIERLNDGEDAKHWKSLPVLSISGGRPYLEFGSNPLVNAAKNRVLQKILSDSPNDGLVPESKADYSPCFTAGIVNCQHKRDYSDWRIINHTHLTQNQEVAAIIVAWLKKQY